MSDADDYLQEGFDPRTVTVPRLRSILVTHNVEYPATAKKPQLVALVTDHVLSQAPKLRAQREKAKRSSFGIVNAGSAEDIPGWADHDLRPTPGTAKRSKSPRKTSTRIKTEEVDDRMPPALSSPTKRASRSASRQLSHFDDQEDVVVPQSARRSRRTITPQIKPDPEPPVQYEDEDTTDEETPVPDHDESVFTDDNPFQGGGSPNLKTPTNRRRTAGGESTTKRSRSARRRTDGYQEPRTPRLSDGPALRPQYQTPEGVVEPGEEFTPDEQLELEEAASKGEVTIVPRKQPNLPRRRAGLKTPLLVLFVTLLGAYMAWYRQEKIAVGYCGLGRPANSIIPPEIPVPDVILPFIEPQCEQCPSHAAYCYEDFSVRCEPDFILKQHPLSLGGLIPLPPSCEPDGEKARRVKAVADKAVEELRERRAKFECGDAIDEEGTVPDTPTMAEEELKQTVSKKRSKRMNSDEFDDLWIAAIGEVTSREEVVVATEASGSGDLQVRRLSSTSLARLPLSCALRRSVRLSLERYRLAIGLLMTVVLGVLYLRARYRKNKALRAQVPSLVDTVLARLVQQKELCEGDEDEPWLFLPNLRDDVLRSVHVASERQRVWNMVSAFVQQNSNVRTSQRESSNGEIGRAWEWIGPLPGDRIRKRRSSGRLSVGWASDVKPESPAPGEGAETKRWEEARPIY
ncbi:Man1-Src1p-C-terminal domain-containing protein [Stachybotrys elegans]|uniref:Man1-Src1p-C-terminal domain-containing protein n=1 Tax=Stachybotrys elegans TaxID=80388 RepID=A0A8K0SZB7_9HYPO|nr:Man1-Src1p-C-terminal domain-containing protein [Stachybotrys elegans]